jgi:putative ABC transport system ATP-binding protein
VDKLIELQDIKKHYKVGTQIVKALQSISLSVGENEYVAIMGSSGSGKSTLMNIIGCLDTPTLGSYALNKTLVNGLSDNQLAEIRNKEIGFIFQTFNLLPRSTALDNVILPLIYRGLSKKERTVRAQQMLTNVGLEDRMDHQPNELSGGQRQRVAIARALVNQPSILLADEPTGNLDSKTSIDIMNLLENIHKQGNTIILVTHEPEIAQHAKRIIYLKDGLIESDKLNKNRIIS